MEHLESLGELGAGRPQQGGPRLLQCASAAALRLRSVQARGGFQ